MNAPATRRDDQRHVKLHVDDFLLLRERGVFAGLLKNELLDGEIWVVPAPSEGEEELDAMFPFALTDDHHALLRESGLLAKQGPTKLIDGVVYHTN